MAVTVLSAVSNNPGLFSRVFLLSADIRMDDLEVLNESLKECCSTQIELLRVEAELIEDLYVSGHISVATYLRFMVADLLPKAVSAALYLDCDTATLGDLSELSRIQEKLDQDSPKKPWLGAAVWESTGEHLREFGFESDKYFNAGVILINIDQWRKENVSSQLFTIARNLHGRLPWWDQDVLNLVMESRWLPLPASFNATWADPEELVRIAHFSGKEKPWNYGCTHPLRRHYDEFRSQTPFWPYRKSGWIHFVKKSLTPLWWSSNRKTFKRAARGMLALFRSP